MTRRQKRLLNTVKTKQKKKRRSSVSEISDLIDFADFEVQNNVPQSCKKLLPKKADFLNIRNDLDGKKKCFAEASYFRTKDNASNVRFTDFHVVNSDKDDINNAIKTLKNPKSETQPINKPKPENPAKTEISDNPNNQKPIEKSLKKHESAFNSPTLNRKSRRPSILDSIKGFLKSPKIRFFGLKKPSLSDQNYDYETSFQRTPKERRLSAVLKSIEASSRDKLITPKSDKKYKKSDSDKFKDLAINSASDLLSNNIPNLASNLAFNAKNEKKDKDTEIAAENSKSGEINAESLSGGSSHRSNIAAALFPLRAKTASAPKKPPKMARKGEKIAIPALAKAKKLREIESLKMAKKEAEREKRKRQIEEAKKQKQQRQDNRANRVRPWKEPRGSATKEGGEKSASFLLDLTPPDADRRGFFGCFGEFLCF